MGFLGSLVKAVGVTVSPLTWVAARGVELVTGNDNLVRNNPLTYYTDLFKGSEKAQAAPPAGGAALAASPGSGLDGYPLGSLDYEAAMREIDKLAAGPAVPKS